MLATEQLEKLNIVHLAVLCQSVADDAKMDESTAEKAWQLKREWVLLVMRETPLSTDYKEHKQIEAEKAVLKARMVAFLATV
jgi:hypothetical protein